MTIEELSVKITAQTSGLKKELDKVQKQLKGFEKSTVKTTTKVNSAFKNMFKGVGWVAVITGLVRIGKTAINTASQLEEVQNVVDVAFGNMADDVNVFSKSALKSFGLTELSAKRMASTYMAMSNGMGIAKKTGKEMSLSLTALAGDMASFYNVSSDVADTALHSVFTGETESLKKFGIVLTDTNLKTFALSQGIKKQYKDFSQAEKVMLRYSYVLNATQQAQGDFSRTSGNWANQLRVLKGQLGEILGMLGTVFKNILLPIIRGLNYILGIVISIFNVIAKLFGKNQIKEQNDKLGESAEDLGEGYENATDKAEELKKTVSGFDELNLLNGKTDDDKQDLTQNELPKLEGLYSDTDIKGPEGNGITKWFEDNKKEIEAFKESIQNALQPLADFIALIASEVWQKFGSALETIANWLVKIDPKFLENLLKILVGSLVVKGLLHLLDMIIGFKGLWTSIKSGYPIISYFANLLEAPFQHASGAILHFFKATLPAFWTNLKIFGGALLTAGKTMFGGILGGLKNFLGLIFGWVKSLLLAFMNLIMAHPIGAAITLALTAVVIAFGVAGDEIQVHLSNFFDWLHQKFTIDFVSILGEGFGFAGEIFNGFGHVLDGIFTAVGDVLNGLIDLIRGVFTADWGRAWEGVVEIVKGLFDGLIAVIKAPLNIIIGIVNGLLHGITDAINAVKRAINAIHIDIPDWVPLLGGKSIGFNLKMTSFAPIPLLANGGVIEEPTVAMMGEYKGAKSNPEIVAPQNILKQTIDESNGGVINAIFAMGSKVAKAVEDKDTNIYMDTAKVSRKISREQAVQSRNKGVALVNV